MVSTGWLTTVGSSAQYIMLLQKMDAHESAGMKDRTFALKDYFLDTSILTIRDHNECSFFEELTAKPLYEVP